MGYYTLPKMDEKVGARLKVASGVVVGSRWSAVVACWSGGSCSVIEG